MNAGEIIASLLMGLNSVERRDLVTQDRAGISGAVVFEWGECDGI